MNRTGAGGWLLSLFSAANYQRGASCVAEIRGNGYARIGTPSLLFAVLPYQHLLSRRISPVPELPVINPITPLDKHIISNLSI
jgi:hypothetical protein